jgi:hypothetical protein
MASCFTTGIMKSGTHALQRAVALFGGEGEHGHIPWDSRSEINQPHLYIIRNPRNVLVSWVRHTHGSISEELLFNAIDTFEGGTSMAKHFAVYDGWLTDPGTLVVTYERLLGRIEEMQRIAVYLGLDATLAPAAFTRLPFEETLSRNTRPSDWRQHWTPALDDRWQRDMSAAEVQWQNC